MFFYCILFTLKNVNRGAEEPSAQVHFTVTGFKESSAIRPHTNDPIWEEAFRFLLHNPEIQDLTVEVSFHFIILYLLL